jgi:hypothetical protein
MRPADGDALGSDAGVLLLRFDNPVQIIPSNAGLAREGDGSRRLPGADLLAPAGVTLAAGIVAVLFKQEADARYDRYLRTADASLLSDAKKYDIYSGAALAVLQIGLGYFLYRLFSD